MLTMKGLERLLKEGECDAVADAVPAACNDGDFTFLCWDVPFNVELGLWSGKRVGWSMFSAMVFLTASIVGS